METISTRLGLLRVSLGFKHNKAFSEYLGYANSSTINSLINGTNGNPTYDLLYNILNRFPKINPAWLMTGNGQMFIDNEQEVKGVGHRILMICELQGISKDEFAQRIGKPESMVNSLLDTKPAKIGMDFILEILDTFPNIRAKWFVYGNEPMTHTGQTKETVVPLEIGKETYELIINVRPR
jgi:transcriptional regulator with XRE-family HTH domain